METDENRYPVPESIVLDPFNDNQLQSDRQTRQKRRRKLVVDDATTISGEEMKSNMADFELVFSPDIKLDNRNLGTLSKHWIWLLQQSV